MEQKTESGFEDAVAAATAQLCDPAVFKALNVDPQVTTVELCGSFSFSLNAMITVASPGGHHKKYFMKTRVNESHDDLYYGEFLGLQDFRRACSASVPAPIAHGNFSATTGCFLIMEYLEQDKSGSPSYATNAMTLAQKLARLHTAPTPIPEGFSVPVFGFPAVTYCGPTAQPNKYMTSWHDFFVEDRMKMIFYSCELARGSDDELKYWVQRTIAGPIAHLLADGHLGGEHGIKPALVHGDLWYGNKMRGSITGSPTNSAVEDILFDPSPAWCHNEFEMGIVCLFGGFSAGFFQEYSSLVPRTTPVNEYEDRVQLYMMYHQLNHYALFGEDYRRESISRMRSLCDKYPVKVQLKSLCFRRILATIFIFNAC